jgi:hypothetical protein
MDLLGESGESSASEHEHKQNVAERIRINKKYARKFETEKRFQDLQRAKEISLEETASDAEDSSESETEDEEAEALSSGLELKVFIQVTNVA